jgi:hypothetical protein
MQATFGFASHSVARAAVEVGSATARGSASAGPFTRAGQFLGYFAIASLPLVVLVPIGLASSLRRAVDRRLLLIGLPSLLYLGLVTALVFAGVYTGSHRYYYPALPGLALLAAGAAGRLRMPFALVPVVAAIAVAVGFVPVLNGLAGDNRGLRAAGFDARAMPGALLTDSPAAAYFSHKPPSEIYGSRVLPADRTAALAWMQGRSVDGVVVENIDYYRASTVWPDLVSGQASEPFVSVGLTSTHIVPGGKHVYVYRVGPLQSKPLLGDASLGLEFGQAPQRGKTAPLTKGVVIQKAGADVTGEGMGFGVPIARYPDGWHYSGTAVTTDLSTPGATVWRKTYDLDMVGGDLAHGYRFQRAPSAGRIEVTYRLTGGHVKVEVRPLDLRPGMLGLTVLNEQSAVFDDFADGTTKKIGPAFGNWEAVSGGYARLRAGSLGIEWVQSAAGNSTFHAGREIAPPDFDWSGLEYDFGSGFRGVDYTIDISKGATS